MTTEELVGSQVRWEKVYGKEDASMYEHTGFGCFEYAEVDGQMKIAGDYGITTSRVHSIEEHENGITVFTRNSIYLVSKII